MNQVVALKKEIPMPPENLQDDHIQKLYKDVLPRVVRMTPEWARELLSKNTRNRQLSDSTVKTYMDQMTKGLWEMNAASIKVARDGTIIDGQHRLEAVSRSGCTIDVMIVYGLDPETFLTIDCGKNRSNKDFLYIHGAESSDLSALAAVSAIVVNFDDQGVYHHGRQRMSPTELVDFVDKNPRLDLALASLPTNTKRVVSRAIAGAMFYQFTKVDETAAALFFEHLISGVGLVEGSPILALRNRLQGMLQERVPMGATQVRKQIIAYFCFAWRAYKEGRSITNLSYKPEYAIQIEGLN